MARAGCPVCARYADEVKYLRAELAAEREARRHAPAPPVPPAAPPPDPQYLGESGEPLVKYDGRLVPLKDWERAMRGLDAALAGKAVETGGEEESPL